MNAHSTMRYVLLSGLLLTPFIAFVVTHSILFPFITGKTLTFRVLVELLFLIWVFAAVKDTQFRPQFSTVFSAIVLFIGSIGLSTLFAVNTSISFWSNYERMEGFVLLIHLLLYFVVLVSVLRQQQDWDWFWYSFLFASAIMGAYNLYQIVELGTSARIGGTFGNPTYLSAFMLFLLFVNLFLFVQKKVPLPAFAALATVQCVVIYYTGTRGAAIGLFGGLFVIALLAAFGEKQHQRTRLLASGLIAALLLLAISLFTAKNTSFVQDSPVLSRFANISINQSGTKDSRLYVWPMAIEGLKEKPLLGWGQDGFRYVFDKHYNPEMYGREAWFDRVHNAPLDWLVAGGVLGFLTYCGLFIAALHTLWQRTILSYAAKSVLTGLLTAYMLQNLFVFDSLFSYMLFFSLLAYLHFAQKQKDSDLFASESSNTITTPSATLRAVPVIVLVACVTAMYAVNYKPFMASRTHVEALSSLKEPLNPNEFMRSMEKALAYNTFGNSVFRQQLANAAPIFLQDDTLPTLTQSYFNLTDREYEKQIRANPRDTLSRLDYGLFLSRFEQTEKALHQYKKALELSPNRQSTWLTIGAIYLDLEEYAIAAPYFKHAFELAPQFDTPRIWYANALIYLNEVEESDRLLANVPIQKLIADDRLIDAHILMNNHKQLVPLFSERVRTNPDDPQANVSLAVAYLRSERFEDAALVLEFFLVRNPNFEQDLRFYIEEIKAGRDPSL